MDAIQPLIAKAKESPCRVVLPEGADGRILEAARRLKDDGIAEPVLLGLGAVDGISCIDPETSEDLDRFA